jgi:hypothetical protein
MPITNSFSPAGDCLLSQLILNHHATSHPYRLSRSHFGNLLDNLLSGQTTQPARSMPGMSMPMDMKMDMPMAFGPIQDSQEASDTAWQPAETPMHAMHSMVGDWTWMMHYNAFLTYDNQSGARGDDQINSINWLMLMPTKRASDNELTLRGMFSLEPATTTKKGYPLLFQFGEAYNGRPLIDRQHPHDLFMELDAGIDCQVLPDLCWSSSKLHDEAVKIMSSQFYPPSEVRRGNSPPEAARHG